MKRPLLRGALLLGAYLLVEWLFAYVSLADGLVTPRTVPSLAFLGLGAIFLALRLVVRVIVPASLSFSLIRSLADATRRPLARKNA
jgi:hypothetical protein